METYIVHPWNNGNFLFNVKPYNSKKINIDFLSGYPGLFDYLNFLYHTFLVTVIFLITIYFYH